MTKTNVILLLLIVVLFISSLCSARFGAVEISTSEIWNGLLNLISGNEPSSLNERIFYEIRLPRVLMGIFVGASLAVGGVLVQALFRNPIVEPGLIGTSSGAAFGAALYFVLGASLPINLGEWTLPISACIGGVASTAMVFYLSNSNRMLSSSVVALLLTGIAVNALFLSGVGFLSYIARDPQARSITFWNLGTLSGSYWQGVLIVGVVSSISIGLSWLLGKRLNALMLGESEAGNMGVNVNKLKFQVLLLNVIMVAVATAFVGVIGFVGLIVPHMLRMAQGSDNRGLIPAAALLGGSLLVLSDLMARLLVAPAEMPIGIVTSIVGAPLFIVLLKRLKFLF